MLEVWKSVVGYEGLYAVSDQGRVKSLARKVPNSRWFGFSRMSPGRILSPGVASGNRHNVGLCREGKAKNWLVAHLVAAAFLGPRPEGLHVLHWNDITTDDRLGNLRYGTRKENAEDKVRNGKTLKGVKHHKAKLNEGQVLSIKKRLLAGEDHHALAVEFGVTSMTMQSIKHGRNWGWLKLE